MFLGPQAQHATALQHTVLIINTILLIGALVVFELLYAETPKTERRHLRYFYPIIAILVGLLGYAIYRQVKAG